MLYFFTTAGLSAQLQAAIYYTTALQALLYYCTAGFTLLLQALLYYFTAAGFQYSAMQSATEKAIYFYGYSYIGTIILDYCM